MDSAEFAVELYRCTECGKTSVSRGWLHGHIQKHTATFGIIPPWKLGDAQLLDEMTEAFEIPEKDLENYAAE